MALEIPVDPTTLSWFADEPPTRRRRPNPVPVSRIPRTPRPRSAPAAPVDPAALSLATVTSPVYLAQLRPGREEAAAHLLQTTPGVVAVWLPRTAGVALAWPGTAFVAVAPNAFAAVQDHLARTGWGRLDPTPVPRDVRRECAPWCDAPPPAASPVMRLAAAIGSQGAPVDWAALQAAWQAGTPLAAALRPHTAALRGTVWPLPVPTRGQPWLWEGLPVALRPAGHATPGRSVLAAFQGWTADGRLRFDATDPAVLRVALADTPAVDGIRDPGHWAVVLLADPGGASAVQTARAVCGWAEAWDTVSSADPVGLVRTVLRPAQVTRDRAAQRLTVRGIPPVRRRWISTVSTWLSGWIVVEG